MYIVAGLGNPGKKYERSRHNTGFMALDYLAGRSGIRVTRSRFFSLTGEGELGGQRLLLLKPMTYMNDSGRALAAAADFYRVPPERVIVLCDDVNLDAGRMRIRDSGSAGGQNGLKDIIAKLGSDRFPRVRIGVGKKPRPDYDLADWVLGSPSAADRELIEGRLPDAAEAVELILSGRLSEAQSRFN